MKKVTRRLVLGLGFACLFMCIMCAPDEVLFKTNYNNTTEDTLTIVQQETSSSVASSNYTYTYTLNPNEIGYGGGGCMMRMKIL